MCELGEVGAHEFRCSRNRVRRSSGAGVLADSTHSYPLSDLSSPIFCLVYINLSKPYCPQCLLNFFLHLMLRCVLCVQLYYSLLIYTSTLCRILISWFINKIGQNSALWVFVMEHITGVQPSISATAIIIATGLCLCCVKKNVDLTCVAL